MSSVKVLLLGASLFLCSAFAHASPLNDPVLPPAVAAWTAGVVHGVALQGVHYTKTDLPFTGQSLHAVKATSGFDGRLLHFVFDKYGNLLPDFGAESRLEEKRAYYQLYGAIDTELLAYMASVPPDTLVPVSIWLAAADDFVNKQDFLANPALAVESKARTQAELDRVWTLALSNWGTAATSPLVRRGGVPLAESDVTVYEIMSVYKLPGIASIAMRKPRFPQTTAWKDAVNAAGTGVTGSGYSVCLTEGSQPDDTTNLTIAQVHCGAGLSSPHATLVASVLRNSSTPSGIAPGASIDIANFESSRFGTCSEEVEAEEDWCVTRSDTVWVYAGSADLHQDRLLDWHVKHAPYPFIAVAAGNDNYVSEVSCGTSCGSNAAGNTPVPFGTLIVGGVNDCGTSSRTDDTVFCRSKYLNPASTDRELPEIAAPAQNITANGVTESGTSLAAPIVAGAAAQIMQKYASLSGWPEGIRPILLVGANKDIDGNLLTSLSPYAHTTDDRDGAGELNVGASVAIAASANRKAGGGNTPCATGFDFGSVTDTNLSYQCAGADSACWSNVYSATTTSTGKRLRVALAWDASANCTSSSDSSTCGSNTLDGDFDLQVIDLTNNYVYSSYSNDNSYEFIDIAAAANHEYQITIVYAGWNTISHQTYMGVAWNID